MTNKTIPFLKYKKNIHFIGIGGSGMSAIADTLLELNYKVTGSDIKESMATIKLKDKGAKIDIGHHKKNVNLADVIVYSNAIDKDNPELIKATKENIPILKRAEMLNHIISSYKNKIMVTGTHGKTTTSGLIAQVLSSDELNSSYIIGADLLGKKGNFNLGNNDIFIVEADESDGSFLMLDANYLVITNIEYEHMDFFKSEENLIAHFNRSIKECIQKEGVVFLNKDNKFLCHLSENYDEKNIRFFSINNPALFNAADIEYNNNKISFMLVYKNKKIERIEVPLFGHHNIYNALAAIAVAYEFNWPLSMIKKQFANFPGISKRCECIGRENNIEVYNDYGHHPTEIKTTLKGLKKGLNKKIICVFQPHRFSRVKALMTEFIQAFEYADILVLTEIYASNEKIDPSISGKKLFNNIKEAKNIKGKYIAQKSYIPKYLQTILNPNDAVVVMGAGDIHSISKEILMQIESK